MTKISIIVPVYNVEKYIDKCLDSLVKQTLQDIEIVIVNDESQDRSEQIIEKYMIKYPLKIKYYEKKNGGLSSARNYGLEYATGEYIAFLDSDDYVEPIMYEEMYKLAKNDKADIVECDFIWEWEYGKKVYDKRKKYKNREDIMKRPRVVAWNKIYKRELINKAKIRFPDGLIYEDIEFFYKIFPYVNKISYLNKYFVHYIQRNDSISKVQTEKTKDIFYVIDNIFDYYKEKNLYEKYKNELRYMSWRILLGSSLKRILQIKDKYLKRKMIIKTIKSIFKYSYSAQIKKNKDEKIKDEKIKNEKNEKYHSKNSDNKKRICFGITKLDIGGAERVLVDIANELLTEYEITIFSIYGGGEFEKELNSKIKLISLFKNNKKKIIIPIFVFICGKLIYNIYLKDKFDIDIAFLEGPITRIFASNGNDRKIAWVHNDISKVFGDCYKAKIKKYIDKKIYRKYDEIIFVSMQNKKSFENIYGDISNRKIIYNYINKDRVEQLANEEIKDYKYFIKRKSKMEKRFITVSRLVKQKGIERLIKVHKKLIDEGLKHKIYVIGEGEEKDKLLEFTKELNIENTFIFLGKKTNPYPYIKKADYYTLFSYFEGYGMVLEEAKILNKPILVTNTAAKEAVINYDKKIIIENNEDAIYKEMKNVLLGKYKFLNNKSNKYDYDNRFLLEQIKAVF